MHEEETSQVPEFIDADYLNSVGATKLITLESAIRVKSCYTCKEPFNRERMVAPYNFIFSRKTKRLRPDGNGGQIRGQNTNFSIFLCTRHGLLRSRISKCEEGEHLYGKPNISLLNTFTKEVPKTERLLGSNCPQ